MEPRRSAGNVMHNIGVCSWSLRPGDAADLAARTRACGLGAVQLALDPIRDGRWSEAETVRILRAEGIKILSGMMAMAGEDYSTLETIRRTGGVRLDATWKQNLEAAKANAHLAARLDLRLVTFHAGFLPHEPGDRERGRMIERLRMMADIFAASGIGVGLETGQECAPTLLAALRDLNRPTIGVNFDPGNMVLYGMGDPVESLAALGPWVRQVHIKDAVPTSRPGEWGSEVVAGAGAVQWAAFFATVKRLLPKIDLVIEREAGEGREPDVRSAHDLIRRHVIARRQEPVKGP
jgi:sugar phosphate isomerase/epimerase